MLGRVVIQLLTRSSGKNKSPAFLLYDTDRTENKKIGGHTDTQTARCLATIRGHTDTETVRRPYKPRKLKKLRGDTQQGDLKPPNKNEGGIHR
jgi:hypothetical protein